VRDFHLLTSCRSPGAPKKGKYLLRGAGSIMNLSGKRFGSLSFGDQSTDAKALQADRLAVGSDIRKAFKTFTGKEMTENNPDNDSRILSTK
ncbi:MAG: hypothetical protein ACOYOE_13435, partial [Chlorobium sp.]